MKTYASFTVPALSSTLHMARFNVFLIMHMVAQVVKNLPAMQEIWVRSLCWEVPLEKGVATHSSILAWRIPWTQEPTGGLQSMGLQRVRHDWATNTYNPWKAWSRKTWSNLQFRIITGNRVEKKFHREKSFTLMDNCFSTKVLQLNGGKNSLSNKWGWGNWIFICKRMNLDSYLIL